MFRGIEKHERTRRLVVSTALLGEVGGSSSVASTWGLMGREHAKTSEQCSTFLSTSPSSSELESKPAEPSRASSAPQLPRRLRRARKRLAERARSRTERAT